MIEIAFCYRASEIFTDRKVIGREREEGDRGGQDKSADGCRAHVVGWMGIFLTLELQRAGAISESTAASMMQAPAPCKKGDAVP